MMKEKEHQRILNKSNAHKYILRIHLRSTLWHSHNSHDDSIKILAYNVLSYSFYSFLDITGFYSVNVFGWNGKKEEWSRGCWVMMESESFIHQGYSKQCLIFLYRFSFRSLFISLTVTAITIRSDITESEVGCFSWHFVILKLWNFELRVPRKLKICMSRTQDFQVFLPFKHNCLRSPTCWMIIESIFLWSLPSAD